MDGKRRKHKREDEHQVVLPDRTAKASRESLADDAATRASTQDAEEDVSLKTDDAATAIAAIDGEVAAVTVTRTTDDTGAPAATRTYADILAEMADTDSDKTVKPTNDVPEGKAGFVEPDGEDDRALTTTSISNNDGPVRYNGESYYGNQAEKAIKLMSISGRPCGFAEDALKDEFKPKDSKGQAEPDMNWGREFVRALWHLAWEVSTPDELNNAIQDEVDLRDSEHLPDFGPHDRASAKEVMRAAIKLREAREQRAAQTFNDEAAYTYQDFVGDDGEDARGSYADIGGDGDYEAYEYRDYEARAGNMAGNEEDDENDEDEDNGYSADLSSDDEE